MSNIENIYAVTKDVILDLKDFEEDEMNIDMTFEDLDLDSLDFVEMQVVMKKNFKVTLDPEMFESGAISTLRELCDYVDSKREAA
ncbi:acyl carrier protein [Alteromonas macleodii]|uniref:Carrier domain-containing protein n=1 Tax=Alteromonas macleodii TaxID=28108 RepID=A0A6T9Y377_ALTMA|nr:acyl carrier protein [Alteromonas macleodii]CAB9495205.1 conserved protein of unknown function [Alteromonas macleodii]